jgi:hypothetical protein
MMYFEVEGGYEDYTPHITREKIKQICKVKYVAYENEKGNIETTKIYVIKKYKLNLIFGGTTLLTPKFSEIYFINFLSVEENNFYKKIIKKIKIYFKNKKNKVKELNEFFKNKINPYNKITYNSPFFDKSGVKYFFIDATSELYEFPFRIIDEYQEVNVPYFLVSDNKDEAIIKFKLYCHLIKRNELGANEYEILKKENPDLFFKLTNRINFFKNELKNEDKKKLRENNNFNFKH